MNHAGTTRIENLFEAALDLAPEKRGRFLNERCADDPDLRRRVERLLELDGATSGVLAKPSIAPGAEQWGPSPSVFAPGKVVAEQYRIERVLGEGGMGTVFLARQINPPRPVALKVIAPGRGSSGSNQLLQRFEREAKALGRLHHPGIATIFEAGSVTSDGRRYPFFAMEYVDGPPLIDYATRRGLGPRERIALIAQVADAVQHAHEQHVVHRDLKPANILVTGSPDRTSARPAVKVLDFGIARLMRREGEEPHSITLQTDSGQLLGTLPYMSPEQVGGNPREIDERTDVYALGVILFELLTGRLPYSVRGKSVAEAARIIRDEEPSRLSAIDPHLHGDIETIVLKAIDKDKLRRYGSAAEFAADIRRFLREEPITARPPSAIYRMRKFARRNRALVGGVVGIIVALVIGLTLTSVFAVRAGRSAETARQKEIAANEQRRLAEQQAYRASVAAAVAALESHNVAMARTYLADAPEPLRGWEWEHLVSRLDDSVASFSTGRGGDWSHRCWPDSTSDSIICAELVERVLLIEWLVDSSGARQIGQTVLDEMPTRAFALSPSGQAMAWATADGSSTTVHCMATALSSTWPSPLGAEWNIGRVAVNDECSHLALAFDPWEFDGLAPLFVIDLRTGETSRYNSTHSALNGQVVIGPGSSPHTIVLASGERTIAEVLHTSTGEITPLRGHTGGVLCTGVSPDGRHVATGSRDSTWRLWDAQSGEPLAVRRGHRAAVYTLQFSPDGRWLVTGSDDHSIGLWNLNDDAVAGPFLASVLRGHEAPVRSVVFGSGGDVLVSTDSTGAVRIWNLKVSEPFVLRGHTSYVYPVVASPDGRTIASGAWDAAIWLWDISAPMGEEKLAVLEGHTRPVLLLAFDATGERLVSYADAPEGTLRVWDVQSRREIGRLPYHARHCTQLAFHPDNERVFLAWVHEDEESEAAAFDERRVVGGRYWNPRTAEVETQPLPALPHPGMSARRSGIVSPDGSLALAIEQRDGLAWTRVFDSRDGEARYMFAATAASPVIWLPTRRLRLISADDVDGHTLIVRDALTGEIEHVLRGHAGPIFGIAVSPDKSRLVTSGRDQSIHVWDITSLDEGHMPYEVAQLQGHESYIWSLAFTPDGRTLVTGSGDHTVRIWDTKPLSERSMTVR